MRPSETLAKHREKTPEKRLRARRQRRTNRLDVTYDKERERLQFTAQGALSIALVLIAITVMFIVTKLI